MALPRTKTSGSAFTAVVYITLGAIMDVWSGLWYVYMRRHDPGSDAPYFWCYGFFLTGLALIIIGVALGKIGRAARPAEAPPEAPDANAPPPAPAAPPPAMSAVPMQYPAAPVAPVVSPTPAQPVANNPNAYQPR